MQSGDWLNNNFIKRKKKLWAKAVKIKHNNKCFTNWFTTELDAAEQQLLLEKSIEVADNNFDRDYYTILKALYTKILNYSSVLLIWPATNRSNY